MTGLKPVTASPFRPLDDRPLDEGSARACEADYRLQPLREQLLRLLRPSYERKPATDGTAPRIGLFGGLGQGKTSLVDLCLADLEKADRAYLYRGFLLRGRKGLFWRDFCSGPRVARFNVSDFKADDLEWRFFTTVLWHRILGTLAWVLPLFALLIFLISQLTVISAWWELRGCVQSGWFILQTAVAGSAERRNASIGAAFRAISGTAEQFQMGDRPSSGILRRSSNLANFDGANCRF